MTSSDTALREALAAIEHERWADWQKWVHSKFVESSLNGGDGSYVALPTELFRQWERQINTPYAELSEAEKASDMEQVDRYWHLIEEYVQSEKQQLLADILEHKISVKLHVSDEHGITEVVAVSVLEGYQKQGKGGE